MKLPWAILALWVLYPGAAAPVARKANHRLTPALMSSFSPADCHSTSDFMVRVAAMATFSILNS